MNRLLLSAAFLAASAAPSAAALLDLEAFDNGTLIGFATSTSGVVSLDVISDPSFATLNVTATGAPVVAGADLSSVTLDVTSGAITTSHTLTIDLFQTGVSLTPGARTSSTFTVNDLIGSSGIGPTTESTFANGTASTLGTLLNTATFPVGTASGTVGPLSTTMGPLFADAQQYLIAFNGPGQSANDTIELTGSAVPEPSTWAMLLGGFALLAWKGFKRRTARFI
jgi:hypothetical protein